MELLVLVIGLVALDVLATRFGNDSRDGFGTMAQGGDASSLGWWESTYEQELAQETQHARQRRLARGRVTDTLPQQAHDDLARAA